MEDLHFPNLVATAWLNVKHWILQQAMYVHSFCKILFVTAIE